MPKPGDSVRQEDEYTDQPQEKRDYWENGFNNDLDPQQQQKLKEQADRAARYRRGDDDYNGDYPRKFDGPIPIGIDHGLLVRNVKQYVADALTPHGDNPNAVAPHRPVGGITDSNPDPHNPQGPPDGTFSGEPNWVCINLAEYMAALLRELGYPVRECNTYLSRDGKDIYQSAALQVWFEGKWHFVDPFTCTYHPAAGFPNGFTDMTTYYWDDVTAVPYKEWRVGSWADWQELDDDDIGGDLQDRFYPPKSVKPGFLLEPAKPAGGIRVRGKEDWFERRSARGRSERSGVYITTQTPGVRMYVVDAQGRVTDGDVNEIPGAFRLAAGTPIKYCKQEFLEPGEELPPDMPARFPETAFVGVQSFLADWTEVGTHHFVLYLHGAPGTVVRVDHSLLGDVHPVMVKGLPRQLVLPDGGAAVRFTLTIDPIDPGFHALFEILLRKGLVLSEEYGPATDVIRAAKYRKQEWQARTRLERGARRFGPHPV
ncbi:MAG: transglutaminase domain-containing protein [Armatimonadota bacterium]